MCVCVVIAWKKPHPPSPLPICLQKGTVAVGFDAAFHPVFALTTSISGQQPQDKLPSEDWPQVTESVPVHAQVTGQTD